MSALPRLVFHQPGAFPERLGAAPQFLKVWKPPWELLRSWALSEIQARTLRGLFFTTVGVLRTGFLDGFAPVFFDSI